MTAREWLDEYADDADVELVVADGFDDAIVGVAHQFDRTFVVYDLAAIIETLVTRDKMTPEEAQEYFEFNIVGAWVGTETPAFLVRPPEAPDVH